MTGNRSRHSLPPDIRFFGTIRLGNTEANTCAYLFLMRLGGSSITSLE